MPTVGSTRPTSARAVYAKELKKINKASNEGGKTVNKNSMNGSKTKGTKRKLKQIDDSRTDKSTNLSSLKSPPLKKQKKPKLTEMVDERRGMVMANGSESPKKKRNRNSKDVDRSKDKEVEESTSTWVVNQLDPEDISAINKESSLTDGKEAFQFVLHPTTVDDFVSEYWEKKPLLIKREKSDYYKGVFSTHDFDKMLREHNIQYTKNLDITSYTDGKRETHNPIGRALGPVVWDYYNNGCSIRLLNPQTFHRPVWRLLSSLQEFFGSFCGANVYLTPPGTQGFAPHWDDIEAFILQLEGQKRWRVYKPRTLDETLPRESSQNLTQEEVGTPLMDVILETGDLLYFPRGYIHQGNTVNEQHSLHITVSSYQKTSWADFLHKLLPEALNAAAANDVEFRKGLPLHYLDHVGIAHCDRDSLARSHFFSKVGKLMGKLFEYASVDGAADQMGKEFIHSSLPPIISADEQSCCVYGGGDKWSKKKMKPVNRVELEPVTQVRLIRGNCIRIVMEENTVKVFYTLENSREYHEYEPQYIELATEHAPAVEALIHTYPNYLTIEDFPLDTLEDKMILANGLWEKGLLLTAQALPSQYDS